MTEGRNEQRKKKPERHPSVPVDAIVQSDVMKRYHGRIRSAYSLAKLVEQCVAEGAPEPITPEGNAQKWGRWYRAALLASIDAKLEQRLPPAPLGWYSRSQIETMLHLGVETVRDLANQLEREPANAKEHGRFLTKTGNPATLYSPVFVEALRRRASQSRDYLRSEVLRERLAPMPVPPVAQPDDLTEAERDEVATHDPNIVHALEGVHTRLREITTAIENDSSNRTSPQIRREIQIALRNAKQYQNEITVLSKATMRLRILGLQRLVERLRSNLITFGVIEDDED